MQEKIRKAAVTINSAANVIAQNILLATNQTFPRNKKASTFLTRRESTRD